VISAVLDTNVFVSAFVFGGNPRRVVQLAEAGAYKLAISDPIRVETEQVLLRKFRWSRTRVAQACDPIWTIADIVVPRTVITAADDRDDNRVLECAWDARAVVIVTGDQDLLRLNPYQRIAIVPPVEFLRRTMWRGRRPEEA
jgi:uncharacterized protein